MQRDLDSLVMLARMTASRIDTDTLSVWWLAWVGVSAAVCIAPFPGCGLICLWWVALR